MLAFASMGMGDGAAVDIAEESHRGVLQSCGALRKEEEEEDMVYHHLFPIAESGYPEGVMIDDHVGCQLGPLYDPDWVEHGPGRDRDVFEAAERTCSKVGAYRQ